MFENFKRFEQNFILSLQTQIYIQQSDTVLRKKTKVIFVWGNNYYHLYRGKTRSGIKNHIDENTELSQRHCHAPPMNIPTNLNLWVSPIFHWQNFSSKILMAFKTRFT